MCTINWTRSVHIRTLQPASWAEVEAYEAKRMTEAAWQSIPDHRTTTAPHRMRGSSSSFAAAPATAAFAERLVAWQMAQCEPAHERWCIDPNLDDGRWIVCDDDEWQLPRNIDEVHSGEEEVDEKGVAVTTTTTVTEEDISDGAVNIEKFFEQLNVKEEAEGEEDARQEEDHHQDDNCVQFALDNRKCYRPILGRQY